jgi:uncharacterized circularly permuted ATP-grasp superfamily protein
MPYFNEIYGDDGQVRPHYAGVLDHWKSMAPKKRRALHTRSKHLFSGDYAQDALPRVLTQNEFEFLSRGVAQRARAILAFLHDYSTRGTRWSRIMQAATLNSIIARHHTGNSLKKIQPDQIAFPYGPDIIRNRAGQWRVVEDSAGLLGGMGDLLLSHKILYRQVPRFRNILANASGGVNDPLDFFGHLAQHFSIKAAKNGGIPLLYLRAYGDEPDRETQRLARAFEHFGIESTTSSNHLKKIQIQDGKDPGIFLKTAGKTQRIGALILRDGPEQFDARRLRIQLNQLKKTRSARPGLCHNERTLYFLRALMTPPLEAALLSGHAWTNFSPGVQFVNDKTFGLYVDTMIRRFLKETPILESIPAKPVAARTQSRGWRLDRSVLTALRRDKDRFVVKQVDDDGGTGVWIGQKESKRSLEQLIEKLSKEPEKYIIQDFEHLSVLDNRIVDLRLHAHVDRERIIVSNTPWGRANWIKGNGKVNIGSNGFTSPVVVMKDKGCDPLLNSGTQNALLGATS